MIKKLLIIPILIVLPISIGIILGIKDIEKHQEKISSTTIKEIPLEYKSMNFIPKNNEKEIFKEIVYDSLTLEELANKLNKSLNSDLTNKGLTIAKISLKNNVDPYLVTAIALHETGCMWDCSYLVKECNNIGGVKGEPSCGGAYRYYNTLDEGITKFIENIKYNYYDYGLTDAYSMQRKYTGGSTSWASKVNNYINIIKNN